MNWSALFQTSNPCTLVYSSGRGAEVFKSVEPGHPIERGYPNRYANLGDLA
jgi:hypothetical protein